MFQPDPGERPLGIFHTILPPHFTGGVAPTRHEVARAAYPEKRPALTIAMPLCGVLYRAACRLVGAVWHPQHGRFAIGQMRSEMK